MKRRKFLPTRLENSAAPYRPLIFDHLERLDKIRPTSAKLLFHVTFSLVFGLCPGLGCFLEDGVVLKTRPTVQHLDREVCGTNFYLSKQADLDEAT